MEEEEEEESSEAERITEINVDLRMFMTLRQLINE